MADNNHNTLGDNFLIGTDPGGPKSLSNGRRLSELSVGSNGSSNLKNLDTVLVDGLQKSDHGSLKVVPQQEGESALMAELKKPQLTPKKVIFDETRETKEDDDIDDDDVEEEDRAMVIDEQDMEDDPKNSNDVEMAEEIDHLNLEPVIVTDQTRKESFLSSLGLVTKQALSELQNKKYTRKRRSTANPHFSNAAIEAKRINQMELAAKKARRKEQMAEMRSNKPARMSLYRRPETTTQLKTLTPSETNKDKNTSLLIAAKKASFMLAQVYRDCFICKENCDTELDVIMFCDDCKCLFHATCAATFDEIVGAGAVPCPKCDVKKSIDDQLTSNQELTMKVAKSIPKPPITLAPTSIKEKPSHKEKSEKVKEKKPKKLKAERTSAASNISVPDLASSNRENGDPQKEHRKLHFEDKRKELESLMEKKVKLEQEWNDRKKKLENIRDTYKLVREKSSKLEASKKTVSEDIDKLVGFIKSVQIWKDIIDSDDSHNKQPKKLQLQQPVITVTTVNSSVPNPLVAASQPMVTCSMNGQPVTLNVPMVTISAANVQPLLNPSVVTIGPSKGPPAISSTISAVGNKIININSRPAPIRAGPINVPQILPKVLTTSVPMNTSNGTIEIMLQRVDNQMPTFNPGMTVRNATPGNVGWVTVPVSSLTGGKILMPRLVTNVSTPIVSQEARTQAQLHRTRKPLQNPGSPYIPIMKATIPNRNVKTYSGVKCSTPEPVPPSGEAQVKREQEVFKPICSSNVPDITIESVVNFEGSIANQDVIEVIVPAQPAVMDQPEVTIEPVVLTAEPDVACSEVILENDSTPNVGPIEIEVASDAMATNDLTEIVIDDDMVQSEVEAAVASIPVDVVMQDQTVEEDRIVKSTERPRRSPRQRESKAFPGFTKFEGRKGRART